MKSMYNPENVSSALNTIKKKLVIMYNKNYTIEQIINAFNKMPGKYQDLLLKQNKDENDKAELPKAYDYLRKFLFTSKNVPKDVKINIKNINEETTKKKTFDIEDTESYYSGDKWVKPKPKDRPILINTTEIKVEKPVSRKKEETEEKDNNYKATVLKKYIEERKGLDIESVIDKLNMSEEDKFIILVKYENDSVKTNDEVSKELGIATSYIDEVVDRFFSLIINERKKKVYSFVRE